MHTFPNINITEIVTSHTHEDWAREAFEVAQKRGLVEIVLE
jgi:hypothetical protein